MVKTVLIRVYIKDAKFLKNEFKNALAQKYPNTESPSSSYAYLFSMALKEAVTR